MPSCGISVKLGMVARVPDHAVPSAPVALDLLGGRLLAGWTRAAADALVDVRTELHMLLASVDPEHLLGGRHVVRSLEPVVELLVDRSDDLLRRCDDLAASEAAAAWSEGVRHRLGAGLADALLAGRVATWAIEARWHLASAHPELVARAAWAPVAMRTHANRVRVAAWIDDREPPATVADRVAEVLAPGRQLLAVDLDAGTLVEVHGDLDHATHVVVWVPGVGTDLLDLDRLTAPLRRLREAVAAEAAAGGRPGTVAVVAWLGYDAPDHLGAAALGDAAAAARAGAPELVRTVAGLRAADAPDGAPRHVTVVGHSYGSLVVGRAAAAGLAADDVVFVGSPGVGVDDADAITRDAGGRVWAARTPDDPIRWAVTGADAVDRLDELLPDALFDAADRYGADPVDPRLRRVHVPHRGRGRPQRLPRPVVGLVRQPGPHRGRSGRRRHPRPTLLSRPGRDGCGALWEQRVTKVPGGRSQGEPTTCRCTSGGTAGRTVRARSRRGAEEVQWTRTAAPRNRSAGSSPSSVAPVDATSGCSPRRPRSSPCSATRCSTCARSTATPRPSR
jgi:hypothetical protein